MNAPKINLFCTADKFHFQSFNYELLTAKWLQGLSRDKINCGVEVNQQEIVVELKDDGFLDEVQITTECDLRFTVFDGIHLTKRMIIALIRYLM